MAVAKGRAFNLYVNTATFAPGTVPTLPAKPVQTNSAAATGANWMLIAGAQERSLTITNEGIDGTTAPSAVSMPVWSRMLTGAKSVTMDAGLRFVNDAAEELLMSRALAEPAYIFAAMAYPIEAETLPGGTNGTAGPYGKAIRGKFLITSLAPRADLSDVFTMALSLASDGPVTYA